MTTPTLINLPPPPSDPVTPSDMGPGTPNSGLSALSTTAIKDGHQGAPFPHSRGHAHQSSTSSTNTLEAERADRISRLAGLERVATARAGGIYPPAHIPPAHIPGYFDSHAFKERSTVGSASATGSVGHTTWASGSEAFSADKMSEDVDVDDRDSVGNVSDEGNASLVGFGEGANSTISGPTSRPPPGLNRMSSGGARPPSMGSAGVSPNVARPGTLASFLQQQQQYGAGYGAGENPMVSSSLAGSITPEPVPEDARMVNGMTFDEDVIDTTVRTPRLATPNPNSGGFDTEHE
ncbi:uncharacterized protein N7496_005215 [Penicillium cataractarum]|uniref:Uncharacterized protein n=1 Tax=Penicillium cataractarum TaxID=2100454 RepID=A0A9W9SFT2_9EURO|nr:uncharacterized protein N7496_005215 [Penicillium cataractarum]KAJ5377806.1 hypothetical protein N7496_005215 [Penicillium cataractarum]